MLDGMRLKISEGNSKLGKIPNLSLPPVTTCRPGAPCATEGCYAVKFYRMYPTVRSAWDSNLRLYQEDPDGFFSDLIVYLTMKKPERFRLFVSGDFPDEIFFVRIMDVFGSHPETKVLCFTKRFEYPLYITPRNVNMVLSMWPGLEIPDIAEDFPCSWLSTDVRRPIMTHIKCVSNCMECGYKCFTAVSRDLHCVFDPH
jgi:hypothetical protein